MISIWMVLQNIVDMSQVSVKFFFGFVNDVLKHRNKCGGPKTIQVCKYVCTHTHAWLVVWNMFFLYYILGRIIPTDYYFQWC